MEGWVDLSTTSVNNLLNDITRQRSWWGSESLVRALTITPPRHHVRKTYKVNISIVLSYVVNVLNVTLFQLKDLLRYSVMRFVTKKVSRRICLSKLILLHILVGFRWSYVKMEGAKFLDPWTPLWRVLLHRWRPGTDLGHNNTNI